MSKKTKESPPVRDIGLWLPLSTISLIAGLGLLAYSWWTAEFLEDVDISNFAIDESLRWGLMVISATLIGTSFIGLNGLCCWSRYSVLGRSFIVSCLSIAGFIWIALLLLSTGAITFIVVSFHAANSNSYTLTETYFTDPVNTFQLLVYNKCCAIEEVIDDDYYNYAVRIADNTQPQRVEKCPEEAMELNQLCNNQVDQEKYKCSCFNDNILYDYLDQAIYDSSCVALDDLLRLIDSGWNENDICGYDKDLDEYSPKLYQQRFSSLLGKMLLPVTAGVSGVSMLLLTTACCGCIFTHAKERSRLRTKKRKQERTDSFDQAWYQ